MQPIESDLEIAQKIEFVDEDFKRVIITIFYIYKKVVVSTLSIDIENIKKISIKFLETKNYYNYN